MEPLDLRLERARTLSWERFGKRLRVYLPGMFSYYGLSGRYPALSLTGSRCALSCDHCGGKILDAMVPAETPEALQGLCRELAGDGHHGVLLSGGCNAEGALPWGPFLEAIARVKRDTGFYISIHCGLVDLETARALLDAGVDQALIDVIGDDETYRGVYHVPFGVERIEASLEALTEAGLPVVPHIVCGLDRGRIRGEYRAARLLSRFPLDQIVVVSLMRIRGTALWGVVAPRREEILDVLLETRLANPEAEISLGCARERGDSALECLAIDAGVNRLALPSEEALAHARAMGLEIRYQRTCCSVAKDFSKEGW